MNREEKLELIFRDEELRQKEMQLELMKLDQLIDSPAFALQTIDDDFQSKKVEVGETDITVYTLDVPGNMAAVVTHIGNDWYPGIDLQFQLDGVPVGGELDREVAPTNNPTEVKYFAVREIEWIVSNSGSEARDIGIVTGGHYIPENLYEKMASLYETEGMNVQTPSSNPQLMTDEGKVDND